MRVKLEDCQVELLSVVAGWFLLEVDKENFLRLAVNVEIEVADVRLSGVVELYVAVINCHLDHRAILRVEITSFNVGDISRISYVVHPSEAVPVCVDRKRLAAPLILVFVL